MITVHILNYFIIIDFIMSFKYSDSNSMTCAKSYYINCD